MVPIYLSFSRGGRQGCHRENDVPGVYQMKFPKNEITVALVHCTREIVLSRRAISAAATIKITTMAITIVAGLTVLLHALSA
jgi:hypothetical protein